MKYSLCQTKFRIDDSDAAFLCNTATFTNNTTMTLTFSSEDSVKCRVNIEAPVYSGNFTRANMRANQRLYMYDLFIKKGTQQVLLTFFYKGFDSLQLTLSELDDPPPLPRNIKSKYGKEPRIFFCAATKRLLYNSHKWAGFV